MRIVIFGASGATGRPLVAQAIERGHQVVAFVRDPSKFEIRHAALQVVQGDVNDNVAVQRAMEGTEAVLSALGTARRFCHDPAVIGGIRNIVRAMTRDGPARIIYVSGLGVREARQQGGLFFRAASSIARNEIADHEVKESIIRPSNLEWTIVRPPILTQGPRAGHYRHGIDIRAQSLFPKLSRADLADFMLNQLIERSYVRKAVVVMY